MKKIITIPVCVLTIILVMSLVSSSAPFLGTFQRNTDIELKQSCVINGTFCDGCNISSIDYPNGSRAISNLEMTKRSQDFNYTFAAEYTDPLGRYKYNGFCYHGSDVRKTFVVYFDVNSTGNASTSIFDNVPLLVFGILAFVLIILGVYFRNPYFGFIGSIAFLLLGVYTMIYGFNNMTNFYTRGIAIIILGLGVVFMFTSAYEWIYSED